MKSEIDMTEGHLWSNILFYSIPLMFAQLLEVMFNMSDVAVVGKFSSYTALGSVGSTTLLVSLFTGLLIGLGAGINVRIAYCIGSRNKTETYQTIHSSYLICIIAGVIITILCIILARPMLVLIHTKDDLLPGAVLYFRIYALGMPAMAIYNCGNGILSACGDTKKPLIYLSFAGVLNVLLNLIFVIVFKMAAEGVALASIIAQYLSALLVTLNLVRRDDDCHLDIKKLKLYKNASRAVLIFGIPSGIQNAIFAVANLFVQTGVNSFDTIMVSGNSAAANSDSIIYNVMAAFHTACASFIGQNHGAGKKKRVLKSYLISLSYSFISGSILGILLIIFGRQFLSLFASNTDVINAGMERIRIMGISYGVSAFMDCTIAASRGIGKTVIPTITVIIGSCVFRVLWIYTIFAYFHTITSLYLLYMFSWGITAIVEIAYFTYCYRKMN